MIRLTPELHDLGKLIDNDAVIGDFVAHPDSRLVLQVNAIKQVQSHVRVSGHTLDWIDWDRVLWETLTASPDLKMVRVHHQDEYKKLPLRPLPPDDIAFRKRIVLLKCADHYASTFSRSVPESADHEKKFEALGKLMEPERKRVVLWHKETPGAGAAVNRTQDFIRLLQKLEGPDASFETFATEYQNHLFFLPENAGAPRNVTSLLTHMTLVGKVYRFLVAHYADREALNNEEWLFLDNAGRVRTVGDATKQAWRMTLATIRLRIAQHPVRVGDLNVFRQQEEALHEVKDRYSDQLLFFTNDSLWLMLPSSQQVNVENELRTVLAPLTDGGFWAEVRSLRDVNLRVNDLELQNLQWQHLTASKVQEDSIYQYLPPAFEPPICSICQMRPAMSVPWPSSSQYPEVRARGGTPEEMCAVCVEVRDIPAQARFSRLARWHPEDVPGGDEIEPRTTLKTAWIKLTLDYDVLIEYLHGAFKSYLDSLAERLPPNDANTELARQALQIAPSDFNPLALMADFTEEYRRLTIALHDRLTKNGCEFESIREREYKDFFVLRVESGADVLEFLQWYGQELLERFPDAISPCPIRLSLNVSQVKYPFYEHWRYISVPRRAINLQIPGIACTEIDAPEFMEFLTRLDLRDPHGELRLTKTYLERLRSVEIRTGCSRPLIKAVMLSDMEAKRIPQTLRPFVQMVGDSKIGIQDILDWHKITTWGSKHD